jgi:uncharacterized protein with HEPN domain
MSKVDLIDNFEDIKESISLIEERFSNIKKAEDLVESQEGVLILDAISMRLQIIGESLKNINKINKNILLQYREIEWDKIIRLRDIISHHYDIIDHEVIFDICTNHIPKLKDTVQKIINDFSSSIYK